MQSRMIRFCTWGSSSMPSSEPRSPRATMIAPDASMIPVRFSTAARVSILATSNGPRGVGLGADAADVVGRPHEATAPPCPRPSSTKASSMHQVLGGRRGDARAGPTGCAARAGPAPSRRGRPRPWRCRRRPTRPAGSTLPSPTARQSPGVDVDAAGRRSRRRATVASDGSRPGTSVTRCPVEQVGDRVAEGAQADLRAGQVDHDPDRAAHVRRPRRGRCGSVASASSSAAVGQADAGHVHAGLHHLAQHGRGVRRGPDGGDDLGATGHAPQATPAGPPPGATWPAWSD